MPRRPVIEYRGSFSFDLSPARMWQALQQPERFEQWWAWLAEFRLVGDGLVEGAVLHGTVSPPVPYQMGIEVHLDRVEPEELIEATVTGDLRGPAQLRLRADGAGTRAEVTWSIEMMQRPMRLASRVAHPLLRWGHDRVVEITVAGFRRHLQNEISSVDPAEPTEPTC